MKKVLTHTTTYLVFILSILFFPCAVFASVRISEIMYDPPSGDTNHEWIEIQNDSDTEVDISGWKLFENNGNHTLTLLSGVTSIPAHGFAIIADNATTFQSDWPTFAGTLFDSAFSLSNTGETISIKDSSGNIVDEATYSSASGASGDGNTLSGSESVWVSSIPTPGNEPSAEQSAEQSNDNNDNNENSDDTGNDTAETDNNTNAENVSTITGVEDLSTIKTQKKITAKVIVPIGANYFDASIKISASVVGVSGKPMDHGYIMWNFGDGEMYTSVNTDPSVHVYAYPGRYVVQINYFEHYYDTFPVAEARAIISIIPPKIEFTDDGLALSIKNTGKTESDISNWSISATPSDHSVVFPKNNFTFPQNTYLLAGSTVILEKKKNGIPQDAAKYYLMYPNMLVATTTSEVIVALHEVEKIEIPQFEKIPTEKLEVNDNNIEPEILSIPENSDTEESKKIEEPTVKEEPQVAAVEKAKSKIPLRVALLFAGIVSVGVFASLIFSGGSTQD